MSARRIPPKFVPKIWGSTELEPWFPNPAEKIGEVWFAADDLLIKFLFTTEPLSVQVHPGDEYAREHEQSRGKTEMWYILRAEPEAKVALGFQHPMSREKTRDLLRNGSAMDHLAWHDARPGDTFFTQAGTVHAIGAGLALCEIQQNSDITYRIFDYGRGRELHLEQASDVAEGSRHPGAAESRLVKGGREELLRCEYFVTEKKKLSETDWLQGRFAIVLEGDGLIDGEPFQAGSVWDLGADRSEVRGARDAVVLVTG